jgi:hypothetical protein
MAAAGPPVAQPTFNWTGPGTQGADNGCTYFESFQFCSTT